MENNSDPLNTLNDLLNQLNHLNLSNFHNNLSDLNHLNHLQNSPLDPTNSLNQVNSLHPNLNGNLNSLNPLANDDHFLLNNHLTPNLDHHYTKQVLLRDDNHFETYTTIDDYGTIYKHTSDGHAHLAGEVKGRSIYNNSGVYLGYAGQDGYIYHRGHLEDYKVGYVDDKGHIYRYDKGTLYDTHHTTSKGIIGGAAYMLIVEYGGVN